MEADQERLIWELETAEAERFWGTEGGVVSVEPETVTVALAVAEPEELVAVNV